MTDLPPPSTSKPIDKFIPWFFVIFFVVLTIALGAFTWIAVKSNRGVVTENAYKKGLAYNSVIEKQKQQDALAWQADLAVDKQDDGAVLLRFTLKNKQGMPLSDAAVQAVFVRPTEAGHDVTLPLTHKKNELYTASTTLPFRGLWVVRITAQRGQDSFQYEKRVSLP